MPGRGPTKGVKRGRYTKFSTKEKRNLLREYETLHYGEKHLWLARHGLSTCHIDYWKKSFVRDAEERHEALRLTHKTGKPVRVPKELPPVKEDFSLDFL